jgi:hypothetical protein
MFVVVVSVVDLVVLLQYCFETFLGSRADINKKIKTTATQNHRDALNVGSDLCTHTQSKNKNQDGWCRQ